MTTPPLILRRLTAAQWQVLDAGLAVIVMLLCWYAATEPTSPQEGGWREPIWVTALAGIALGAPAAIRRSRPLTATAVVLGAAGLSLATGVIPDFASAAPIVATGVVLYTVGTSLPRRRSLTISALAVVVFGEALVLGADTPFDPGAGQGAAFAALILGSCWALGWTVRERRAYAAQLSRQATERAVNEERLRIAREMHDIVAHSMSVIAVKATIANHVADERPQEVRDALRVIETTSRTALTELRRTLGALRTDPDLTRPPDPGRVADLGRDAEAERGSDLALPPDLAPAPGIADLPRLVEVATSAGVDVRLEVRGVADLPEGVGLAVFRIVQEALTNVVKHAEATHCRVTVEGMPGAMIIEIVDDGRGGAGAGGRGQGLIGMQERVALYGGELEAAPEPAGGWAVRARLDTAA